MGPHPAVASIRWALRRALGELTPGALVLVACSGGADSLALAAAAAFEAPRVGLRAGGLTVDHGLQAGSAARASDVAATLRKLELDPVEVEPVEVGDAGGPEAAARDARYAALDAAAERLGAAAVLLGHTRDDQAETVLLGLGRGSGARSLAGMPATSGRYVRPLLDIDRATTRAACTAEGHVPWDDPHNADPSYARARIRQEALPALERALGGGATAALARTAGLLRDDADALDGWADAAARRAGLGPVRESGDVELDVRVLADLPPAVRGRVVRRAALAAGSPAGVLGAVHVRAAERLVVSWRGQQRVDLPGGVTVRRRGGKLLFAGR